MVKKNIPLGGFMALKLKKIGGITFVVSLILAFFIEDLRKEPSIAIIMIISLTICALGFYIERRKNEKK